MLLIQKLFLFGGSQGIGERIARKFLQSGWSICVFDLVEPKNKEVSFYQCDLADSANVLNALVKAQLEQGLPHAVVNSVRFRKKQIGDFYADWDEAFQVDFGAYLNVSKTICELSKENGVPVSIINISSVLSEVISLSESMSYCTAKAAINQMTRYLAVEYGPYGVRINTVSPGLISNNDSEYASDSLDASLYSKYANLVPLRRSGSPDEVADLALFLALSSSSFITGQNIVIDGGLSLREQIGVL